MRLAIAATLLVSFAVPALATSTTTTTTTSSDQFYLVQDPTTKRCTVTTTKPAPSSTTVVVGDGTVYKSRTEAEAATKTVKVCTQ